MDLRRLLEPSDSSEFELLGRVTNMFQCKKVIGRDCNSRG